MQFGYGSSGGGRSAVRLVAWLLVAVCLPASMAKAQENNGRANSVLASSPAELLGYSIDVIEVPDAKVKSLLNEWQLIGGAGHVDQSNANSGGLLESSILPGLSAPRISEHEFRLSPVLSDEQSQQLLELGTVTASPKLIGENGAAVSVGLGRDLQFVVSYKPETDESGRETGSFVPVTVSLHDGIALELSGALDEQPENVDLQFGVTQSRFERLEKFTLELPVGPRLIDQPIFQSHTLKNRCRASLNKTVALSSGPVVRESIVQKPLPLLGQLPWVGKSLEYTSKSVESVTTIILVRCVRVTGQSLPDDALNTTKLPNSYSTIR